MVKQDDNRYPKRNLKWILKIPLKRNLKTTLMELLSKHKS